MVIEAFWGPDIIHQVRWTNNIKFNNFGEKFAVHGTAANSKFAGNKHNGQRNKI